MKNIRNSAVYDAPGKVCRSGILLTGIVLFTTFLFSCSNTEKLVREGKYEEVIEKTLKELKRKPVDLQKIAYLDNALEKTTVARLKKIDSLKLSGQPAVWSEVLQHYEELNKLQARLMELPDTTVKLMRFQPTDYSSFIAQARLKASEYHYQMALRLLNSSEPENKNDARKHLLKVHTIYPGFRDVDSLLTRLAPARPVKVYYEVINQYRRFLPYPMMEQLLTIQLEKFNSERMVFHNRRRWLPESDYVVRIYLQNIRILPEQSREINYVETAEIVDGVTYLVDENRNFVYDSLGRKIEQPRFKTIACYVTETIREKAIKITGKVEIIDRHDGKTLIVRPVEGESVFTNRYATFKGDLTALSPEARALLGTKKEPFPTDEDMMLHAGNNFKNNAGKFVQDFLTQRLTAMPPKN